MNKPFRPLPEGFMSGFAVGPLVTRSAFRERYDAGQPAHRDEFLVTMWHHFAAFADDGEYVDPWVIGAFVVFEAAGGEEAWFRLFWDFAKWLLFEERRGEIVAALVAVADSATPLSVGDAVVEVLGATGWPRGVKLAQLFREDIANPPRSSSQHLIERSR